MVKKLLKIRQAEVKKRKQGSKKASKQASKQASKKERKKKGERQFNFVL